MTKNRIRTALVGCGRVSRTAHYDVLQELDDFDFVAVCDNNRARADEWAQKNGTKAYYSLDELLDGESLDFVTINTPNGLHARHATKVVERGINVMVEKPLGMLVDEADDLIDMAEDKGVRLYNVLQNRFNDTNQLLKKSIDRGRFGRIFTCNVTMRWCRSYGYYTEGNGWRMRRDLAGGVFTNQAIHYVDTMQWLVGAPAETVYAKMGTCVHPVDVETHGSAILSFKNGIIGSLNLTILTYPEDREGSITIMGEKGTVKVGGTCMNKILEWDFAETDPELDEAAQRANYEPPTVYGFGHQEMYRRIGRQLRHGDQDIDIPNGREGRKSVEILEALYRSEREGGIIRLPLGRR